MGWANGKIKIGAMQVTLPRIGRQIFQYRDGNRAEKPFHHNRGKYDE